MRSAHDPSCLANGCRIKRQSRVRGLSLVDVNHPQHTTAAGLTPKKLQAALRAAGLAAGAVCLRYPAERYSMGALSNPDAAVRAAAVQLAVEGCRWAAQLGARDLILWTQFDGYDYAFQARVDGWMLWGNDAGSEGLHGGR